MSPRLQVVLPDVSIPRYSSVRQIRVWGATGVSETKGPVLSPEATEAAF